MLSVALSVASQMGWVHTIAVQTKPKTWHKEIALIIKRVLSVIK
jgi:hypothetical protein